LVRRLLWIVLIGTAAAIATCGDSPTEPEVMVLWVAPYEVDCVGVGPQKCLLVSTNPDEDWEYLYAGIRGFTFEPGFTWRLRVRRLPVADPAADAGSMQLVLLEILDKTGA
jgi:hypothetical protein